MKHRQNRSSGHRSIHQTWANPLVWNSL